VVVCREPCTISIYDLTFVAFLPWEKKPDRAPARTLDRLRS
jgi:hypothetical protein